MHVSFAPLPCTFRSLGWVLLCKSGMGSPSKYHFLENPRNSGHSSSSASENMQKTHKKCVTFQHMHPGEMLGYVALHTAESMWTEDPRDIGWEGSLEIHSPTSYSEQDHHQYQNHTVPGTLNWMIPVLLYMAVNSLLSACVANIQRGEQNLSSPGLAFYLGQVSKQHEWTVP